MTLEKFNDLLKPIAMLCGLAVFIDPWIPWIEKLFK